MYVKNGTLVEYLDVNELKPLDDYHKIENGEVGLIKLNKPIMMPTNILCVKYSNGRFLTTNWQSIPINNIELYISLAEGFQALFDLSFNNNARRE